MILPTKTAIATTVAAAAIKALLKVKPKQVGTGIWLGDSQLTPIAGSTGLYTFTQDTTNITRLVYEDFEFSAFTFSPTDLGSIPKLFHGAKSLRLKPDSFKLSYILHDYVYKRGWVWARPRGKRRWCKIYLNRAEADILLLASLIAEGATAAEAYTIYHAVRVGAGVAWKNHRNRDGQV